MGALAVEVCRKQPDCNTRNLVMPTAWQPSAATIMLNPLLLALLVPAAVLETLLFQCTPIGPYFAVHCQPRHQHGLQRSNKLSHCVYHSSAAGADRG